MVFICLDIMKVYLDIIYNYYFYTLVSKKKLKIHVNVIF